MKILYIRHGESYGNLTNCFYDSPEVELTSKGRMQAAIAGQLLKKYLDNEAEYAVYCSPWIRALHTCEIALRESGLRSRAVIVDERLRERSFAGLVGRPINYENANEHIDNAISWEDYIEIWTYDSPKSKELGVETLPELKERMESFLIDASCNHADETIVVFSHGGFGRMLQGFCEVWPEGGCFHKLRFFENGEVATLHFD